MRVYSLYDRKMKEFGQLVLSNNDETVTRALIEGLKGGKGATIHEYPKDFDLVLLGQFDPETGELVGEAARVVVNVGEALSLLMERSNDG